MAHDGEDSAFCRGSGPYRLTFQAPDLMESDSDSVSFGPPQEAPASIWAPGKLGSRHYRIIYQIPDLIESDSDSSISLGPLHEAESSLHSSLRGYSQADGSAE